MDELDEKKDIVLKFLEDFFIELKKSFPNSSFSCLFAGSIEERFGVAPIKGDNGTSQLGTLVTDFDIMICCNDYTATFNSPVSMIEGYMRSGNHSLDTDMPTEDNQNSVELQTLVNEEFQKENIQNHFPEETVLIEDIQEEELGSTHIGYAQLIHLISSTRSILLDPYYFLEMIQKAARATKLTSLPADALFCNCDMSMFVKAQANIAGPSIKVKANIFECDITFCIKCPQWPISCDWLVRPRLWPSQDDVERIASEGFHFVAKPLHFSKTGQYLPSWRYSFSKAEVLLSNLVPETARRCMIAMKIILKEHLQVIVPQLSSYHIKTIFFHTLENKPPQFWADDNIEECFHTLLSEIHSTILSGHCQHYWLKDVNLFDILSEANQKRLPLIAKKLEFIKSDPAPFIYDDGMMWYWCNYVCRRVPHKKTHEEHLQEIV